MKKIQDFLALAEKLFAEVSADEIGAEFKGIMWVAGKEKSYIVFASKDLDAFLELVIDRRYKVFTTCKATFMTEREDHMTVFDELYEYSNESMSEFLKSKSSKLIDNQIKSILKNGIRFSQN